MLITYISSIYKKRERNISNVSLILKKNLPIPFNLHSNVQVHLKV
jgi:hypothetical protein